MNRKRMLRLFFFTLLLAAAAWAASVRLYLKDGTYHMAREYKVEQDRVRFYSTERSAWEELPLELVDLKRTQAEVAAREQERQQEAVLQDAEERVERAARREVERVPQEKGVYLVSGSEMKALKLADTKVATNKGRSILKVLTPVPVVTGKATVEIDGMTAPVSASSAPEFYIRLTFDQHFGIARLKPGKKARVVEKVTIVPLSNEYVEEPELVEIFQKQVDDGLYKIWPMKPLPPGEYAVIEFTPGKLNLMAWDFSVGQSGAGTSSPRR